MKRILLLIIILNIQFNYAQNNDVLLPIDENSECGTVSIGPRKTFTISELGYARQSNQEFVLNVFVHYIDNIVPANEQENNALNLIGGLNLYFNSSNIFFKYKGHENIPDNSYLSINSNNVSTLANNYETNNIDVFICEQFVNSNGQATSTSGVTYTWTTGAGVVTRKIIVLRSDYTPVLQNNSPSRTEMKYYTSVHEMGHYLGLYHPHQLWKNDGNGHIVTVSDSYTACDRIEENLDNSEALIYGDLIADTNPDRVRRPYWGSYPNYTSNCLVSWTHYHDDTCGRSIDQNLFNPPMDNIMAYYHHCRIAFSPDQYSRMRAYISSESNGGFLTNQLNTIESLYEPYYAEIEVDYNWVTSETTTHGSVTTCYGSKWVHKFQKGFDYDFYHWNGGDASNSDYLYSKQIHEQPIDEAPLRAVKINQVSTTVIKVYENTAGVRPSTDSNCTTARVTGGKVISSDINGNRIDVKDLNANEITDPNLIQTLENNKIHHIKKDLDNGKEIDKVIYKTD